MTDKTYYVSPTAASVLQNIPIKLRTLRIVVQGTEGRESPQEVSRPTYEHSWNC